MPKKSNNDIPAKILRIGVIKDNQVINERLILPGKPVTIGTSSDNLFQISDKTLPQRFTLFHSKDHAYYMNFVAKMQIRVSLEKTPHPEKKPWLTSDIIGMPQVQKKGETSILPLEFGDKGSVNVGEYRFLFQFIDTPPIALRALRSDYNNKNFTEEDKAFFSFLSIFSALASTLLIYVLNTEPAPLVSEEEKQERFAKLLEKPPLEEPPPIETEGDPEPSGEVDPNLKGAAEAPAKEPSNEPTQEEQVQAEAQSADNRPADNSSSGSENMSAEQYEQAQETVRNTALFAMLATRGEGKGTVSTAFGEGGEMGANLDQTLQGVSNGAVASANNQQGTLGQKNTVGRGDVNIGNATAGAGGNTNVGKGPAVKKVVSGRINTASNDWSNSPCPDVIKKTVRSKSAQVKFYYEKQLKSNPDLRGRLVIGVEIVGGAVEYVDIIENQTGNSTLANDVKRAAKKWKFGSCETYVELPFALSPS